MGPGCVRWGGRPCTGPLGGVWRERRVVLHSQIVFADLQRVGDIGANGEVALALVDLVAALGGRAERLAVEVHGFDAGTGVDAEL